MLDTKCHDNFECLTLELTFQHGKNLGSVIYDQHPVPFSKNLLSILNKYSLCYLRWFQLRHNKIKKQTREFRDTLDRYSVTIVNKQIYNIIYFNQIHVTMLFFTFETIINKHTSSYTVFTQKHHRAIISKAIKVIALNKQVNYTTLISNPEVYFQHLQEVNLYCIYCPYN